MKILDYAIALLLLAAFAAYLDLTRKESAFFLLAAIAVLELKNIRRNTDKLKETK